METADIYILNSPLFREFDPRYDEDSLPPIGLGYIASHLESAGLNVTLIDAIEERIPLKNLIHEFQTNSFRVLALNIFTTNYDLVKELVEGLPDDIHVIIGGLSTKDLYHEILRWEVPNKIDVVIGDGELICLDLIKGNLQEAPFDILGNKQVFKINSNSHYYVSDIDSVSLNRFFFKNEPVFHPFGFLEANIVASRGCIFNCTFCAAARSVNKEFGIRERSAESLKKELKDIRSRYPLVTSIRVLDDLFLKNSRSIKLAIDVFENQNLQWRSMAHVTTFSKTDAGTIAQLKASGCKELFIGIESGSPRILKKINKTHNTETIIKNLSMVLQAGIDIKGYFIFGFPDETIEDMEMTYQLAKELKLISRKYFANFRTSVFQYRPYHGTQIFHDLQSNGVDMTSKRVEPDDELSNKVGRIQFNFHSGNHSRVDKSVVHDYIYRTTNLTDPGIFDRTRADSSTERT